MTSSSFDPNGVGLKNGRFIGLPFTEETAQIVLLSIPWDVTTSYNPGTSVGPANILEASSQLDLGDLDIKDAWQFGIYMRPSDFKWWARSNQLRSKAQQYINFLEEGEQIEDNPAMATSLLDINEACSEMNNWVQTSCRALLQQGKLVGLVGGDHSTPLGYLRALAERHPQFSVLQFDAHQDLRSSYEGFLYSHASIYYNALQLENIQSLTQVGIRDWCDEEYEFSQTDPRIHVFYDQQMREAQFAGKSFSSQVDEIIDTLTDQVYISFDIDGLDPKLCPNTGTPVPGGLSFQEALFIVKKLVQSGRTIIGFDLCEVAGSGEWDGNVGARLLYKLSNWMKVSQS